MKLTPLNLVSAIGLVVGVMLLFNSGGLVALFYILTAIFAFIADLVFRKFIPLLGKLWLIEGLLVVFTIVLMLILKSTTT